MNYGKNDWMTPDEQVCLGIPLSLETSRELLDELEDKSSECEAIEGLSANFRSITDDLRGRNFHSNRYVRASLKAMKDVVDSLRLSKKSESLIFSAIDDVEEKFDNYSNEINDVIYALEKNE